MPHQNFQYDINPVSSKVTILYPPKNNKKSEVKGNRMGTLVENRLFFTEMN